MDKPPLVGDIFREILSYLERGDADGALKHVRKLQRLVPDDIESDFLLQYKKMEYKLGEAQRHRANAEALLKLYSGEGMPEAVLNKIVCGALKSAINDHGPIDKNMIGSGAKRVIGEIKSYLKGKQKLQESQAR